MASTTVVHRTSADPEACARGRAVLAPDPQDALMLLFDTTPARPSSEQSPADRHDHSRGVTMSGDLTCVEKTYRFEGPGRSCSLRERG